MSGKQIQGASSSLRTSLAKRLDGLDQRRLQHLHAAVTCGSIRAGAERIGTSASSITRHIQKMEDELQISLLERHGRGVHPTRAGQALVDYYQEQRARLTRTIDEIGELFEERAGTVSLATEHGFIDMLMDGPLKSFMTKHPGIKIDLQLASTEDAKRRVLDDEADLGLVYSVTSEPQLHSHEARRYSTVALVKPDHPLTKLERKVIVADLSDYDLGMFPNTYGLRQSLVSIDRNPCFQSKPRFTSNAAVALTRFAIEMNGIIFTSTFSLQTKIAYWQLVPIEIADLQETTTTISLFTRRGRQTSRNAAILLRMIRTTMAGERLDRTQEPRGRTGARSVRAEAQPAQS